MSEPVVNLDRVAVQRPGVLILNDVSLRVHAGESVGLFGANGSGKTTLLRVIATLIKPASGRGTVMGAELGGNGVEEIRHRIGLIGHEPTLAPDLTIAENLDLLCRLGGTPRTSTDLALVQVGLSGARDRRLVHCSNGMRKRAEFARILLKRPHLLLLDEAHVGLDAPASQLVGHLVDDVRSRSGSVILVSHEKERAMDLIDRAVELRDGGIHAVGP